VNFYGDLVVNPLVSILVPAYNAQDWIADSLRSATTQIWNRKEIIVVDDGSTDHTLDIARHFQSKCCRIVTQDNRGAAAARNTALSLSQGDYIQYLDADDLLAPDKISKQIEAVDHSVSRRTLLSGSFGRFMYRCHRATFVPTPLWCDLSPVEWLIRKIGQDLYMQTGCWLVSRELTDAAGPWNTDITYDDDGEYFCRALLASDGVRFAGEAKVYYRRSGTNSLGYIGNSDSKRNSLWRSMQLHINYIRALEDSERVRAACVRYLQNWILWFHPERPDIVKQSVALAHHLGGRLHPPQLSWKYAWLKEIFGWRIAKCVRLRLPAFKGSAIRLWDKALFHMEETNKVLFPSDAETSLPARLLVGSTSARLVHRKAVKIEDSLKE
jgi:glycosyltransferase involved in cell wall biosynthesis